MTYLRSLLPPYYKYAIFMFVGFEFLYTAVLLAISEAYYKSAALVLPTAYKIFDDTILKKVPDFEWNDSEKYYLEMYKYKMMFLWLISTIGVLLCMLMIIPQFFDFNDRRGNPSHLCLVREKLAWFMFVIMAVFVFVLGCAVFWAWSDGGAAVRSFHRLFDQSEKEEIFLTELERKLDCITDDDKEVAVEHMCWQNIRTSFISDIWLDLLMYVYVAGHILAFLAIPFFNKQLIKLDDDDHTYYDDKKLIEA